MSAAASRGIIGMDWTREPEHAPEALALKKKKIALSIPLAPAQPAAAAVQSPRR